MGCAGAKQINDRSQTFLGLALGSLALWSGLLLSVITMLGQRSRHGCDPQREVHCARHYSAARHAIVFRLCWVLRDGKATLGIQRLQTFAAIGAGA